jgi:hypothetical protein
MRRTWFDQLHHLTVIVYLETWTSQDALCKMFADCYNRTLFNLVNLRGFVLEIAV